MRFFVDTGWECSYQCNLIDFGSIWFVAIKKLMSFKATIFMGSCQS